MGKKAATWRYASSTSHCPTNPSRAETGSDEARKAHNIAPKHALNSHDTRPIETATPSCLSYPVGCFRLLSQHRADVSRRNMGRRSDHHERPAYAALRGPERRENSIRSTLNAVIYLRHRSSRVTSPASLSSSVRSTIPPSVNNTHNTRPRRPSPVLRPPASMWRVGMLLERSRCGMQ